MLITPDFTEAQDEFEPGEYFFRINKGEVKESQKGAKYISWELESFNEEDTKNNGRKMWHTTMIEGPGAGMLKKFYKTCTDEELSGPFDTEQLQGREFKGIIGPDKTDPDRMRLVSVKSIQ